MANKSEKLIADIQTAAKNLGIEAPDTTGKTEAELKDILDSFSVMGKTETKADKLKMAAAARATSNESLQTAPKFYVKKGKALITLRGIISDGAEIKPEDLAGGEDALQNFIKLGYIGKN